MLERDGVTDSMKYMTIEKELSHDDNGQTPIINKRRSKFHGWDMRGEELSTIRIRAIPQSIYIKILLLFQLKP